MEHEALRFSSQSKAGQFCTFESEWGGLGDSWHALKPFSIFLIQLILMFSPTKLSPTPFCGHCFSRRTETFSNEIFLPLFFIIHLKCSKQWGHIETSSNRLSSLSTLILVFHKNLITRANCSQIFCQSLIYIAWNPTANGVLVMN